MKRSIVVTLLVAGLLAVGSASVIRHKVVIADGDPQPPFPPPGMSLMLGADGDPQPPTPPLETFVADGDPQPKPPLNQIV
jgi:hypothetical protein